MATGRSNNKSTQIASRVPHEVINGMEQTKGLDESTGQYIVAALKREIEYRQRVKPKSETEE